MARIDDGFSTTITFSGGTSGVTLLAYEKEVTPPGLSAEGPNDTTTMRNTSYRTKAPKNLITMMAGSMTVAYDPAVLTEIVAMLGVNQSIVVEFPDGSTWTFWGWIDTFQPGNIVEGEQPTAEIAIEVGNQDAAGDEIAPVYAAA